MAAEHDSTALDDALESRKAQLAQNKQAGAEVAANYATPAGGQSSSLNPEASMHRRKKLTRFGLSVGSLALSVVFPPMLLVSIGTAIAGIYSQHQQSQAEARGGFIDRGGSLGTSSPMSQRMGARAPSSDQVLDKHVQTERDPSAREKRLADRVSKNLANGNERRANRLENKLERVSGRKDWFESRRQYKSAVKEVANSLAKDHGGKPTLREGRLARKMVRAQDNGMLYRLEKLKSRAMKVSEKNQLKFETQQAIKARVNELVNDGIEMPDGLNLEHKASLKQQELAEKIANKEAKLEGIKLSGRKERFEQQIEDLKQELKVETDRMNGVYAKHDKSITNLDEQINAQLKRELKNGEESREPTARERELVDKYTEALFRKADLESQNKDATKVTTELDVLNQQLTGEITKENERINDIHQKTKDTLDQYCAHREGIERSEDEISMGEKNLAQEIGELKHELESDSLSQKQRKTLEQQLNTKVEQLEGLADRNIEEQVIEREAEKFLKDQLPEGREPTEKEIGLAQNMVRESRLAKAADEAGYDFTRDKHMTAGGQYLEEFQNEVKRHDQEVYDAKVEQVTSQSTKVQQAVTDLGGGVLTQEEQLLVDNYESALREAYGLSEEPLEVSLRDVQNQLVDHYIDKQTAAFLDSKSALLEDREDKSFTEQEIKDARSMIKGQMDAQLNGRNEVDFVLEESSKPLNLDQEKVGNFLGQVTEETRQQEAKAEDVARGPAGTDHGPSGADNSRPGVGNTTAATMHKPVSPEPEPITDRGSALEAARSESGKELKLKEKGVKGGGQASSPTNAAATGMSQDAFEKLQRSAESSV